MHRRIVEPALARLGREDAAYFGEVVRRVDDDPRTQRAPNLVYLVLRETIPLLPAYLPERELVEALFAFVDENRAPLATIMYDRDFVRDPERVRAVTDRFVERVVALVMDRYEDGAIDAGERSVKRFGWPYHDTDFPFDE